MALVDDLVASDLTQAIVLAGVRHEETLQTFEEGPKRKSRWSECKVLKKGKRWGLPDDKPYKPLPYVDLPIGLSQVEIDQFLREQRLEDLHRKIQGHEMEDVDADIRPPSPPPVYDKAGNRLNTRDIRIRKAMTAEYNRLIRFMIKHVDGYLPPVDWKPAKLLKKIIIPIEKFPQAPFMGVIIGPRGVNHKRLQETTGCKIFIRGRDIGDKWQSDEEAAMPQHVHIEGETEEQILTAERLIEPLLNTETPEFEFARTHGMQQLAMVHGYSLNKAEQRCGICGALGHLGYECPETNVQNYKMANVTCTICGDKGHIAADCKKTAEINKTQNVDWKEMAEKKQEMDRNFSDMMKDVNVMNQGPPGQTAKAGMPQQPGLQPQPGLSGKAGFPMQGGPMNPGMVAPGGAAQAPAMPGMGAPGSVVDKTIICPPALVGKMIGPAGATIKKMAADTGAQVNLDRDVAQGGGKAVIITAADPMIREKAKAHIQNWIRENQAPSGGMGGGGFPQSGGIPQMSPPMMTPPGMQPPLGGGMGLQPRPAGMVPGGLNPPMQGGPPQMRPPMANPPGLGGGFGGGLRPPMQNQQFGNNYGNNMAPGAGAPNFGKVQQGYDQNQGW